MGNQLNSPNDTDDWYACPSCGAEVRVGSAGCRQCLMDVKDEWAHEDYLDGVDLPDAADGFEYEYLTARAGLASKVKPPHLKWIWWITGVILVILIAVNLVASFI